MFRTVCPHCHTEYRLERTLIGKKATCKHCRKVFILEEIGSSTSLSAGLTKVDNDSFFDFKIETEPFQQPPGKVQTKMPAGAWNVGDVILNTYEVREIAPGVPFAAGGVGIVNRVYHREWDIDLAVKSPKADFFKSENGKRSYEKEAQTWIELGLHPNIVTCYLVRRIDGTPRLFAEFVPDGSLRDWMSNRKLYQADDSDLIGGKSLTDSILRRILDISIQFCWGLQHAHQQGLLHLDIKPANVMMSGNTVKVSDFGLSQSLINNRLSGDTDDKKKGDSSMTMSQILSSYSNVGLTPSYCSPEQYALVHQLKKLQFTDLPELTIGTDIWSWAVSVLAMFVGGPPSKKGGQFARTVCAEILQAQETGTTQPFLKIRPELPKIPLSVGKLLMQCFEDDPTQRPPSIEAVAETLLKIYRNIFDTDFTRLPPISATGTPESLNNLAASMLDLNKYDEAVKMFSKALTLQAWQPEITYNQTLSAWRNGKMTDLKAVERLEMLVKMQPKSSSAWYALGLVQRERGNLPSALDAFHSAMEIEERSDVERSIESITKKEQDTERSGISRQAAGVQCVARWNIVTGSEANVLVDEMGHYILYVSEEQMFSMRSAETGQLLHSFKIPAGTVSQNGRLTLSTDLQAELVIFKGHLHYKKISEQTMSPEFCHLNWKRYAKYKQEKKLLQQQSVTAKFIGEAVDNQVILWTDDKRKQVGVLQGHEGTVTALFFGGGGRFAVTGSEDRTLRIWEIMPDPATNRTSLITRCLRTVTGLRETIDAVYLDEGNRFVLSLGGNNEIRLWDVSVICTKHHHSPLLLSFITSSEEISKQQYAIRKQSNLIRQNVKDGDYAAALQNTHIGETMEGWNAARLSLVKDGTASNIWRHTTRTSLKNALCTHTFQGSDEPVTTVALSLDGNVIASAGQDAVIQIWNIAEQRCAAVLRGHRDWIRSIDMTDDAKFLVSGSWDTAVKVWNLQNGQCVRTLNERIPQITKIAVHPLGSRVAIAAGTGKLYIWDILKNTLTEQVLPSAPQTYPLTAVRFSRDGQHILSGTEDGRILIDNKLSAKVQKGITGICSTADLSGIYAGLTDGTICCLPAGNILPIIHLSAVTALSLVPDEHFLLSAAKDGSVKLTNLDTNKLERSIEGHKTSVNAMDQDAAGRRLVTACEDGVVRVWDLQWNYEYTGTQELTAKAKNVLTVLAALYENLDDTAVKRIQLEMGYRGFGTIPPEAMAEYLLSFR